MKRFMKGMTLAATSLVTMPLLAGGPDVTQQSTAVIVPQPMVANAPLMWLNIGAGISTNFSADGGNTLGEDVSLNFAKGTQLVTIRSAGSYNTNRPYDVGVMYGLMSKSATGYVSYSAGVAAVTRDVPFCSDTAVGIPLEIQAFLTPTPHVGFGVIGFGDISTDNLAARSFAGAVLALQVGNLW